MRTYGEIAGVSFRKVGFSIYTLKTEYKLSTGDGSVSVYADTMKELKKEITKYKGEGNGEFSTWDD